MRRIGRRARSSGEGSIENPPPSADPFRPQEAQRALFDGLEAALQRLSRAWFHFMKSWNSCSHCSGVLAALCELAMPREFR
jgi:hypothetical protein